MSAFLHLMSQHPKAALAIGYGVCWVFGAAIRTMPVPRADERWYGWLYTFLHAAGQNLENVGRKSLV